MAVTYGKSPKTKTLNGYRADRNRRKNVSPYLLELDSDKLIALKKFCFWGEVSVKEVLSSYVDSLVGGLSEEEIKPKALRWKQGKT